MDQGGGKVLIFVRSQNAAEDLAELLQQKFRQKCDAMHGKRKQEQRDAGMKISVSFISIFVWFPKREVTLRVDRRLLWNGCPSAPRKHP